MSVYVLSCIIPPPFFRHPVDLSSGAHPVLLFYILGFHPISSSLFKLPRYHTLLFVITQTIFPSCLRRLTKLVGIHQITTYWVILGVFLGLPYLPVCGHQRILFFCFSWLTGFCYTPHPLPLSRRAIRTLLCAK
jgi:hypothetical protein